MIKGTHLKFIAASAGFHLLIGGLFSYAHLNRVRPNQPVSVVQVRLVGSAETGKKTTPIRPRDRDQPKRGKPLLARPGSVESLETEPPVDRKKDAALIVDRPEDVQAVQTVTEAVSSTSTDAPLPVRSGDPNEQPAADRSSSDEMSLFLQDVRYRLERAKRYPLLARIQGQEGTVRVQFLIDTTGEASEIRLLESSRSAILDREAVETVKRVGRFSRLPLAWNHSIQVRVPLVFQLSPP